MRVLFDISTVGDRSGLGRWVRELALEFPRHAECHVTFCACGSLRGVASAAEFLREHPEFDGSGLGSAGFAERMMAAGAKLARGNGGRAPLRRAASAAFELMIRGASLVANRIPAPILAQADIFNSPFGRLTAASQGSARMQRFLTIHDLLPLIMPECFTDGQRAAFARILASIGPRDWLICVSESTREDLCRLTPVRREQTFVIHPGASSDRFYPCVDPERRAAVRSKRGIPPGPYLLSVATLEPRKNLPLLLRAFARWARETRNEELQLVLAGGQGWKRQALLEAADQLGELRHRVVFTGFVDEAELAPLYSDCLAFVYPSFYEGFGFPVLEAMKCGAVVVTSQTSSLPEVIGDAGVFVDPRDEDSLCRAIDNVYNDADLRVRLSRSALERSGQFSWSKCVQQHLAAFRDALAARSG